MIEGSRPLALIYRIYYKLLKTNLNAQALSKSPRVKTLLLQCSSNDINTQVPKVINWNEVKLPTEWLLENEMPPRNIPTENTKLDRIEQYLNGTVKISFDHSKQKNPLQIKYGNSNPRHSYTGSSSSDIKWRDQDLEEYMKKLSLKDLEDIKHKGIKEENSQVQ